MCDDTTADFLCFLINGGPFLTTWHIGGGSSNFPISVAHKMFKPKPAMHPNEFPRICYVRPIFFRLCYVLEKNCMQRMPTAGCCFCCRCFVPFPKIFRLKRKRRELLGKPRVLDEWKKRTNVSRLTNCLSLVSDMLVMFNTTSGKNTIWNMRRAFVLLGHTLLVGLKNGFDLIKYSISLA